MSKRIEIIGDSVVVTDTVSGKINLDRPSKDVYYETTKLDKGIVYLIEKDGAKAAYSIAYEIALADAVNKDAVAFTSSTFRVFANTYLGKNILGAIGDVIVFASTSRTASVNGADLVNRQYAGLQAIIDITNVLARGTVTLDSGESDKANGTITLSSAVSLVAANSTIQFNTALAHAFATATAQCTSVVGADFADGTVVCASVVEGDTVIANGNIYTAVNGAKLDNTEFDMSGTDDQCATDLADSITNDTRSGDVDDVTAAEVTDTVTITSTVRGTDGNTIPLSSSNGARLAVSAANLTGGVIGDTVTINALVYTGVVGAKDDNTQFSVDTNDDATAIDLEDSINNDVRSGTLGDVSASATTDTVTLTSDQPGTDGNAITLAETGTTITISGAVFSGGVYADTITINDLVYTAIAGSKGGDNTKFSIDTSNDAAATDLVDSINNDGRTGGVDDVTASATTDTVTCTQTVAGVSGNSTNLTSTGGARVVLSGATFANGTDADTVEVNGLTYTAVAGAKANNTEFSIDTSNDAAAIDLADAITNDSRTGTLNDVTAGAVTDTVTATTTIGGTVGNATTLSSSDGGRLAVSAANFVNGDDNALVSGITVDGIESMSGTEIFDTDLATTATNIAANITANTSAPNYTAVAVGATITISSISEGDALVVVSTSVVIATTDVNLSESGSVVFTIQGKDSASGKYYTLLESDSLDAVSTTILRIHPSLTVSANLIAKDGLPQDYRVIATHGDALPLTYSVGINLLK